MIYIKIHKQITHILIRASFCTFNFTLPACRPNFADVVRSTSNVEQASIRGFASHTPVQAYGLQMKSRLLNILL